MSRGCYWRRGWKVSQRRRVDDDGVSEERLEGAYQLHQNHLTRFATRWTGNHHDAEDAVQEAMIRLWLRGQVTSETHMRAWLFTAVSRRCTMIRRHRAFHERHQANIEWEDVLLIAEVHEGYGDVDAWLDAERLLAPFSPLHRQCVLLSADGMCDREIGERLGIPRGKVKRLRWEVQRRRNGLPPYSRRKRDSA